MNSDPASLCTIMVAFVAKYFRRVAEFRVVIVAETIVLGCYWIISIEGDLQKRA